MNKMLTDAALPIIIFFLVFYPAFLWFVGLDEVCNDDVPDGAIELHNTIKTLCLDKDLEPVYEPVKGSNGNLFFNITCK